MIIERDGGLEYCPRCCQTVRWETWDSTICECTGVQCVECGWLAITSHCSGYVPKEPEEYDMAVDKLDMGEDSGI